jgi:hypothetical protein
MAGQMKPLNLPRRRTLTQYDLVILGMNISTANHDGETRSPDRKPKSPEGSKVDWTGVPYTYDPVTKRRSYSRPPTEGATSGTPKQSKGKQ